MYMIRLTLEAGKKTKGTEITCTEHEPGCFNGFLETITCILMENINMHVFETIVSLIVSPFFINAVIQCKMTDCQVL